MTIILNLLPKPKGGSSSSSEDVVFYTKDFSIPDQLKYRVIDIDRPNRWRIPKGYLYYTMVHDGTKYVYTVLRNTDEKKYCFISLSESFLVPFLDDEGNSSFVFAYHRIFTYYDKTIYDWDISSNAWRHYEFNRTIFDPVYQDTFFNITIFQENILCFISSELTYENYDISSGKSTKYTYYHYFFRYNSETNKVTFINKVEAKDIFLPKKYFVFQNIYIRLSTSGNFVRYQIQKNQDQYDIQILDEITVPGKENRDSRYQYAITTHQNRIICYSYCYGSSLGGAYYDYYYHGVDNSVLVSLEKKYSQASSLGNLKYRYYWNSLFNVYISSDTILCYTLTNSENKEYTIYKMNPSNPETKEAVLKTDMEKFVVYPLPGLPVICVDELSNPRIRLYLGVLPYFPIFLPKGSIVNSQEVSIDGEITYPKSGERVTIQPSQESFEGTIIAQRGDKGYSF